MSSLTSQLAQLSSLGHPSRSRRPSTIETPTKRDFLVLSYQKDDVERTESKAQLQHSKRSSSRREVMKMMVAGGGFLCLGEGNAIAAAGEVEGPAQAAKNPLIQQLLERSRVNKAVNDQERLDDFYKRNYRDYFEFVEGSVRNKKELTAAEKAIVEWLAKNK